MNWILGASLSLLLAGCDEPQAADTLVISSDPELRAMVSELLPELAARSGLELRRPVRLERRTREQLVSYLKAKLDEELPAEEERHMTRSYALLGLVPEDLDLRGLLLSVYTEQVAGFYDPDSTALFVLADQPTEALGTVLVHELVHAVQDQATDLDSITSKERGNDRQAAAQAAIEGHATLVMLEYMMEKLQGAPVDLGEVEGFTRQLRPALEAVRQQYPALAEAPNVIQEALLFPYLEGAGFVQRMWLERAGRPAPLGEHLPLSTEQILHPDRLGGEPDHPWDLALRVSGARVVFSDGLGELETRLMLEQVGVSDPALAATGWDGDRFALLEGSAGEALVWVTVWDDVEARDRFTASLTPHLDSLPSEATLEVRDVGGVPAAILRVGEVPPIDVEVVELGRGGASAPSGAGVPPPS